MSYNEERDTDNSFSRYEGGVLLPYAILTHYPETLGRIISDCTHSVLKKYFAGSSN